MKYITYIIMALVMVSVVSAKVGRNSEEMGIRYLSLTAATSQDKMYWAVQDTVPLACPVTGIFDCMSDKGPCNTQSEQDSTRVWASVLDNQIRIIAASDDTGGNTAVYVQLGLTGSGQCLMSGGQYVESKSTGIVSSSSPLTELVTISLCNTEADTNCDGTVDRAELGVSINEWINDMISRTILGNIINAWVVS